MEFSEKIEQYVRAVPKAELHVHLEGAIQPATLLILAQRNGVELPVRTVQEMQRWFTFRDFLHFVEIYFAISRCLKTAEDYELIAYEFGANMARQNVRYAEITFSASTHHFSLGVPFDTYFAGLTRGRQRAQAEFGVEMRWVFDIVRDIRDPEQNRQRAEYTVAVAKEGMSDGVVALGLGGSEQGHPPGPYAPYFDKAREAGLHSDPHAGETVGPESVWGALHALGAERLGHGVRSIEDPLLVAHLKEHQIPLELCPTSNLCLGVCSSIAAHPFPRLHAAGIPVTINSDDPPLFNTMLNHEVGLLFDTFSFDLDSANDILLNGVRYSFLPDERKQALEAEFRREMTRLQQELRL
ncbi:MAG TPA: adenosine deaminase [Ktedonobacteraceae bacterium]|nr:adenosine deaminase [Ktedonobacteraceae bacterium]